MPSVLHNQSVTFSGTGMGVRERIDEIVDRCKVGNINTNWSSNGVGATAFAYSSGANGVPMPHPKASKYAVAQILNANTGNAWLSQNIDFGAGNRYIYVSAYRRVDPNWTYGTSCDAVPIPDEDNNLKWLVVSDGVEPFVTKYWYHESAHQKCSLTANHGNHFFSSGTLGTINSFGTDYGGSAAQAEDPFYTWVKVEYLIALHATGGAIQHRINNVVKFNGSSLNTDDAAGTARNTAIGAYSRQRDGAGHYVYLADMTMLFTTGADVVKRVMCANNAVLSSATIAEYCPVTAWSDTSVTCNVNQGLIPDGPAWLHAVNSTTTLATFAITLESTISGGGYFNPLFLPALRRRSSLGR